MPPAVVLCSKNKLLKNDNVSVARLLMAIPPVAALVSVAPPPLAEPPIAKLE